MITIYGSINEWKESSNYLFAKWFENLKKDVENWFTTDSYDDLELDYFEFDSSHNGPIYVGSIYFNELEIQWRLQIILDSSELNDDDTIDEITIQLDGYNKSGNSELEDHLGNIKNDITEPEFTPDFIFEMISEFKEKFIDIQNEEEQIEEE